MLDSSAGMRQRFLFFLPPGRRGDDRRLEVVLLFWIPPQVPYFLTILQFPVLISVIPNLASPLYDRSLAS